MICFMICLCLIVVMSVVLFAFMLEGVVLYLLVAGWLYLCCLME